MPKTRSKKSPNKNPLANRLRRLRREMRKQDLDSLLISNPRDIQYLTGFRGEDANLLILHSGKPVLVSDSRFATELRDLRRRLRIHMRTGIMADALAEAISDSSLATIGIQAEHTTVANRRALAKTLGAKRLRDTQALVSKLRVIKDEDEVRLLRGGVKVQQEALEATLADVKPGMTEAAVAARLEYEMRVRGAQDKSFPSIVAAQANGALPHAVPGKTRIRNGRPLLIDWGACVGGYRSDLTRTFHLGRFSRKMREIYLIVLEAQLAGIDAVRPGVSGKEVDAVARQVIEDAGYGEYFGHGLGHGIGLDVHEAPSLSRRSTDTLETGMVVTVEPGVYLPDIGGVRIEDDVLVTKTGRQVLSNYPKDIDSAII